MSRLTPNQFGYRAYMFRKTLPHGKRPTDAHMSVAWTLARWQHNSPSHAKIAKAVKVHRNTVQNAMNRFRDLGILSWTGRVVRLANGHVARGSNIYSFHEPAFLPVVQPRLRKKAIKKPIFSCPGNFVHRDTQQLSREALTALSEARVAAAWANRASQITPRRV